MLNKLTVEEIVELLNRLGSELDGALNSRDEYWLHTDSEGQEKLLQREVDASVALKKVVDWLQASRQIRPSVYDVRGQFVAWDVGTCTAKIVR